MNIGPAWMWQRAAVQAAVEAFELELLLYATELEA